MNGVGILLILLIVGLLVAWLVAEFKASRVVRVSVGVLAFGTVIVLTYGLASVLTRFNHNAWFGEATKGLIETSVAQIENGHNDRVLKAWRELNSQYEPSYENRVDYKELVESAIEAMKGDKPIPDRTNAGGRNIKNL